LKKIWEKGIFKKVPSIERTRAAGKATSDTNSPGPRKRGAPEKRKMAPKEESDKREKRSFKL